MTAGDDILQRIWQSLHQATTEGTGFTLGFLGTTDRQAGPQVRAIILRRFESAPERLYFATNAASNKVAEIHDNPHVALTLYDRSTSVQLRIEGRAHVIEDPAQRRDGWESLAPHGRQQYDSTLVPGEPLSDARETANADTAFQHFAWISIACSRLDWLDLAAQPHERWQFQRDGASWTGYQVVP